MTKRNNKAYYEQRGRHAYENGTVFVVEFGLSTIWQHVAWQTGYKAARAAWRLSNPQSLDKERTESKQRHLAYCKLLSTQRSNNA
jgi:hypothetical protein